MSELKYYHYYCPVDDTERCAHVNEPVHYPAGNHWICPDCGTHFLEEPERKVVDLFRIGALGRAYAQFVEGPEILKNQRGIGLTAVWRMTMTKSYGFVKTRHKGYVLQTPHRARLTLKDLQEKLGNRTDAPTAHN